MAAIPRRAQAYFVLAFAAVLAAVLIWHSRGREIDLVTAAGRANRLLAVYVHRSGEPPAHFIPTDTVSYPDGWEFAWRYRPCPDIAALKIFVGKSGSASYSALPDCTPRHGFAVVPNLV